MCNPKQFQETGHAPARAEWMPGLKRVGTTAISDGMDEELRKFSANGNFNVKKQTSQSEIILT